jgi:hypothetical protein
MKIENIPLAVIQVGENAMNQNHNPNVRYNYIQTLKNIREYCNQIISQYEKSDDRLTRKTRFKP